MDFTDPELREELVEIVVEILDGLIDAGAVDEALPHVGGHDGVTIESSVPILGDDPATFRLRVPAATGVALAASLTGEAADELGTDGACEAIAELTNMLGGTVKSLIDTETALDVPSSDALPTSALTSLDNEVQVTHQLGTFVVQLGT